MLSAPRLSLDADLSYIGSVDRDAMLEERAKVHEAIARLATRLGYRSEAGADQHAGRTYKLLYASSTTGQRDFLKVDMSYLNRAHLLPLVPMEAKWGEPSGIKVPVNAPIELAAGKMKALLDRVVPRDLYDIASIVKNREAFSTGDGSLDRKVMLFNLTLSGPFPRPLTIQSRFAGIEQEIENNLVPVLLDDEGLDLGKLIDIAEGFINEYTEPQTSEEEQYLKLMKNADFRPELLFSEYPEVLARAETSPAMLWKLKNLKLRINGSQP
ncbi:MAG: nucleotidyl transferase AbiEii/AbiGii toxin family protein [Eggerthellaceae bacterium]|nr:nucleotidyl transferase AbiEii/AbiGii toxin family protein [Eggerthellaceae bacterium]